MAVKITPASAGRWEVQLQQGGSASDRWERSDNAGLRGTFASAEKAFTALKVYGSNSGYFYRVRSLDSGKIYFQGTPDQARDGGKKPAKVKKTKASGGYYVGAEGILYNTATKERVSEEDLRLLAGNAGYKIEKVRERRVKVVVPVIQEPTPVDDAIKAMPAHVARPLMSIWQDPQLNEGMREMTGRWTEFPSLTNAILAGVAVMPESRRFLIDRLDEYWARGVRPKTFNSKQVQPEVVVGAGLHAAIYCATRVAKGFPPPIVLEKESRVGGAFGISRRPSFYLNSRNRPGVLSVPGQRDGTLNYLPYAPVQPSDIDSTEYITNEAMAWVIKVTLAMNATVLTDFNVQLRGAKTGTRLRAPGEPYLRYRQAWGITTDGYTNVSFADRVVLAQGLGDTITNGISTTLGKHVVTFAQFMAKMDEPFPLRGVKRVAVIGAGDSGKTSIEALCGQGPQAGWSTNTLDYPRKITWYGPGTGFTCDLWQESNRTRYNGIGALLPRAAKQTVDEARVQPEGAAPLSQVTGGYNCALVNGTPFDLVVLCTGLQLQPTGPSTTEFDSSGRVIARFDGTGILQVGPMINLPLESSEVELLRGIAENSTSMFRYAGRTAQLGEVLG